MQDVWLPCVYVCVKVYVHKFEGKYDCMIAVSIAQIMICKCIRIHMHVCIEECMEYTLRAPQAYLGTGMFVYTNN